MKKQIHIKEDENLLEIHLWPESSYERAILTRIKSDPKKQGKSNFNLELKVQDYTVLKGTISIPLSPRTQIKRLRISAKGLSRPSSALRT
ncbi:MAG: hypothetical protein HYW77_02830 [Parcubacteria group bacterium]|nr:hypothetical protein [Parcubacteria group bacterium]